MEEDAGTVEDADAGCWPRDAGIPLTPCSPSDDSTRRSPSGSDASPDESTARHPDTTSANPKAMNAKKPVTQTWFRALYL